MNRIFLAMVLVAFATAAWRQVRWVPPELPEPVVEVAPASDDPGVAGLHARVVKLEAAAVKAAPAPVPPIQAVQDAILAKAKASVDLVLGLVGSMCFFLGLMRIAEDGGLLRTVARAMRPILSRLFPDVPPDHPAMGAMILNLSANVLGLGNAATPFGLQAMKELDRLNRYKGTATDAMALFLAINTASVTLLPSGVIVLRQALGSKEPAAVLPTTLFATLVATTVAIVLCRVFQRFASRPEDVTPESERAEPEPWVPSVGDGAWPSWASAAVLAALVAAIPLAVVYGRQVSPWFVPSLAAGLVAFGGWRGVPVYESFVAGAKEGWDTAVRVVPFLVAILCVVGMFEASGALAAVVGVLDPLTRPIGLPGEALPMALLRPLSGSGAYGVLVSTMQAPGTGPDTYVGLLVSTLQGSSETTFYVLAVYFGAVGVRRVRHTLATALTADVVAVFASVAAVRLWFAWNG